MPVLEQLLIVGAGLIAGILTSTVGVASLVSFPALLAVGLPPVVANVSNTLGLTPGGLSGSFGYRAELREKPRLTLMVIVTCSLGAVVGALLLLTLPPGVFEVVVPWLILFTCLLVGAQPSISRWLRSRRVGPDADSPREQMTPTGTFFAALTGIYGGYFGAGSGVMMVAVLGLALDIEMRLVNALKTLAVLAGNVVASIIFLVVAQVDWRAVALLAGGSLVGGYVGARVGRHIPDPVFRGLVVVAGITAAVTMLA